MQIVPVSWSFDLQPLLHIVQITGTCDDVNSENHLFKQITLWLEKASTLFKAQFISEEPTEVPNSALVVRCKLIFRCKEDANGFLGYIKRQYELQ